MVNNLHVYLMYIVFVIETWYILIVSKLSQDNQVGDRILKRGEDLICGLGLEDGFTNC